MKFSFSEIIEGQKKPLDWKVAQAVEAMHQALSLCTTPSIAFSGGKDSTVLVHLAKTFFPEQKFYVLFSNTTVEFPESLAFVFASRRKHAATFYHCSPLGFWTDDDIWEYIHTYEVPYSSLYDMTYTDSKGQVKHVKRNGCVGCATDIAYKDNHLSALKQTHPRLYAMYMGGGLGQEIAKWKEYENAPAE